jgi:uncharacterized membrane protein
MNKGRLEAFSDGVIAIILTIMVLELKVPHELCTICSSGNYLASTRSADRKDIKVIVV